MDIEKYPCIESGCNNMIFFGSRDYAYYKQKGWVNEQGDPIKPKRCKYHRAKKREGSFKKTADRGFRQSGFKDSYREG